MLYEHLTFDTVTTANVATVIADLLNGPQYRNARYTPAVAPRRPNSLAGQSEYGEVEDEITVDVLGPTYGACIRNAETLWGILDQAAEWERGVAVTAIQLRVRAPCSELGDVTCMVLGPIPGSEPGAFSPTQDVAAPGSPWVLSDVSLRFRRRGRFLRPRETAVQSTSSGNPTVQTLTWSADQGRIYAPVGIDILTLSTAAADALYSFLLTASAANAIQLLDATAVAAAAPFTNVNDSADFPYNGTNVRRYTPTGTAGNSFTFNNAINLAGYEQIAIIAAVRNNSASVPFLLRPSLIQANGLTSVTTQGPVTVVEAGYTEPQLVSLGVIPVRGTSAFLTSLSVFCQVSTTSGSPTLDFSHFALIAMDAPGANILAIANTTLPSALHALPVEVMNAELTGVVATGVAATFDGSNPGHAYRGDLEIDMRDTSLYVTYLRTEADNWVLTASGAKANVTFSGYRRRAFLSPQ